MQTPIFFCQLLRKLSMLMTIRSTLTDGIWDAPLQWLYCRHQILVFTREIILSLHICRRDAGSFFSLLWDFVSKATPWPSSYIQVKGYYWDFGRQQANAGSVLCMVFYMVIMLLLLMNPATWLRATPAVRFVNAIYLRTRWEWILFLLHSVLFWELNSA